MYSESCWESQAAVDNCTIDLCSVTSKGPRCGRCKFEEDPRSYMRDDTVCEKCDGTEGPAIIAASVVVPIIVVGVPLVVMRLEHTRAYAYRLYHRWFDIGKFKVVWVNYAIMCSISWNLDLKFPQPFRTLEDIFSFLELSLLRLMPMGCLAPFDFLSDFCECNVRSRLLFLIRR